MFYKDVPDGVNAMVVGRINAMDVPLAVLGGNCSIQGFDFEGNELFWTVTGDNVSALTFCDVDNTNTLESQTQLRRMHQLRRTASRTACIEFDLKTSPEEVGARLLQAEQHGVCEHSMTDSQ